MPSKLPPRHSKISKAHYTGIGSRETPADILVQMQRISRTLAGNGMVLRSGGALGADRAFERGCDLAGGKKQIFIPWKGFCASKSDRYDTPDDAFDIAAAIHPNWKACSRGARMLHARNVSQILGSSLKSISSFVVCWHNGSGGTMTAVNIAKACGIPVFNLRDCPPEHVLRFVEEIINETVTIELLREDIEVLLLLTKKLRRMYKAMSSVGDGSYDDKITVGSVTTPEGAIGLTIEDIRKGRKIYKRLKKAVQ